MEFSAVVQVATGASLRRASGSAHAGGTSSGGSQSVGNQSATRSDPPPKPSVGRKDADMCRDVANWLKDGGSCSMPCHNVLQDAQDRYIVGAGSTGNLTRPARTHGFGDPSGAIYPGTASQDWPAGMGLNRTWLRRARFNRQRGMTSYLQTIRGADQADCRNHRHIRLHPGSNHMAGTARSPALTSHWFSPISRVYCVWANVVLTNQRQHRLMDMPASQSMRMPSSRVQRDQPE